MATKIVFFGNERLATGVTTEAPVLKSLISSGYEICAVCVNHEQAISRSSRTLEIAEVAMENNIPLLSPTKINEIIEQLSGFNAEIGVLVAYGQIVPQGVLDIFPKGIINIHPSLLPLHRGPTPIESVILDGATMTGVSVMGLQKAMDAGPIFGQTEVEITTSESKQSLADKLLKVGSSMINDLLPAILDGSLVGLPQDEKLATYDSLIKKEDGQIDWFLPADQISRQIRAFSGWPKSRCTLANKEVIITEARATDLADSIDLKPGQLALLADKIVVATVEQHLEILRIQPVGKKDMSAKEFISGYL